MELEISSNGLHPERIEPIIRKYPDVKVRFSPEGFETTNNRIRGEKDGFQTKVDGLRWQARAIVLPSLWYENQPLSILEAFAVARLVIASDLGDA